MDMASMRRFPSPLRYPGGKGKIANYLKILLLDNDLAGCKYVEPYAGGAAVALHLLFDELASEIHINDINRCVHAFWQAVLDDTERLCERISRARVSVRQWDFQRAVVADPEPDPLDLAVATFFLNRTNRSGIIDGGMIGGRDQAGAWKLDARFNKGALIKRIERIATYRSRIVLSRLDAAEYIKSVLPSLGSTAFVYLDPPYYVKGRGLYEHFYEQQDHELVAQLVKKISVPWVVSYDAEAPILRLYAAFERMIYNLSYSASSSASEGREVMFFSPLIARPDHASPAHLHAKEVRKARVRAWSE